MPSVQSTPIVVDDASPLDVHPSPVSTAGRRSGRAIASVVIALVGILTVMLLPLLALVLGMVAIIIGSAARGDIVRKGCRGGRQAVAGMVLGVLSILAGVGVIALGAVPA